MKCIIRRCHINDAKEIAKLIYDTEDSPEYEWGVGSKEEQIERLIKMISAKDNRFSYENIIVAELNKNVVGMLLYLKGNKLKVLTLKSDVSILKYQKNKVNFLLSMLSFLPYSECKRKELYLSNVCVDRNYRGNNIGQILINEFENISLNMGYKNISLRANNNKLVKFYEDLGYKRAKSNSLRMIKKLL